MLTVLFVAVETVVGALFRYCNAACDIQLSFYRNINTTLILTGEGLTVGFVDIVELLGFFDVFGLGV